MPSFVPSLMLTNHGSQSGGQRLVAHRVAVVLAGDVAAPREQILHRLVHAAMPVGQLVGVAAGGEREDLVAEADAEDGLRERCRAAPRTCSMSGPRSFGSPGPLPIRMPSRFLRERCELGVPGRADHRAPRSSSERTMLSLAPASTRRIVRSPAAVGHAARSARRGGRPPSACRRRCAARLRLVEAPSPRERASPASCRARAAGA